MAEVFTLSNPPPVAGEFCETPTSREIATRIDLARSIAAMVAIVGAPGIGKTRTLKQYAKTRENVRYCVMSPAFASLSSALDRIGTELGIYDGQRSASTKHEGIVGMIKITGTEVLLIDEAQELSPAALNAIRAIHDDTGITIVLAGNPDVINQFYDRKGRNGNLKPRFAQISRRVTFRVELSNPLPEDVEVLARHWDVHDPNAHTFLKEQAAKGEGLGRMEGLIRIGRKLSKDGPVTRQHLREALKHMRGEI